MPAAYEPGINLKKSQDITSPSQVNCYDLSSSQMSRMILSNLLFDIDFMEYSCINSRAFVLLLNVSTILFLSPGFAFKRWTKKRIVEIFNSSTNALELMQEYSIKSLSNKRLDKIVRDICELLRS